MLRSSRGLHRSFQCIFPARAPRTPFQGELDAVWSSKTPSQAGQNRFFQCFFSMHFSNASQHRFWIVFWKIRAWKIVISPRREHDFLEISIFEKITKKHWFWLHFGKLKRTKFEKKLCLQTCVFLILSFLSLLAIFWHFGSILGSPGPSKTCQKSRKILFDAFICQDAPKSHSRTVQGPAKRHMVA